MADGEGRRRPRKPRAFMFWTATAASGVLGLLVVNLAADRFPSVRGLSTFRSYLVGRQ